MEKIKIIFFDIDGTLIDMEKKQISAKMLETLIRLKEKKIIICLATGRGPLALPQFDEVDFDAFLTFNGSYCFNPQQTILKNPIPAADVAMILKNAAELKRPVAIATHNRMIANGRDTDLVEYFAFAHQEVVVAEDFATVAEEEEIYQIMLGSGKETYPQLMKNTQQAKIVAWWDRAVDIIPSNSGKGYGINQLLAHFGLDKSEALAFGDGNNDIEMLEAVGTGVAMDNASVELKKVADEICKSVSEEGITHYCQEKGLI